jgi:3-phenylpropionate/trans-cinnamate dioxygenase ferredoxin reductase component
MTSPIVVIGANLAGSSAATTLRREGHDGPVIVIGDEPHPPYQRPPLSKAYLRGTRDLDDILLHAPEHFDEHDIELRLGVRVQHLDTAQRRVVLDDGQQLDYHRLLLATGGRNRRPPIPGIDLPGVFDLRTVADADAIRAAAPDGGRAVVVGMGLIGSEVAASLSLMGLEVTAVEPLPTPLYAALGEEIGGVVADLHREHGVELLLGDAVAGFEGDGHLERVATRDGRQLACDLAVVGLGIEPATELAAGTAIEVDNGIVVDDRCRTAAEDVYAAGDVANHDHPRYGRRVRVEHWQNAQLQGATAARNMLGADEVYDEPHWFWSDQYDLTIQSVGVPDPEALQVRRGSTEERAFSRFYVADGRLQAAVGLGRPRDIAMASRLVAAGVEVDPDQLADPEFNLRELVRALRT